MAKLGQKQYRGELGMDENERMNSWKYLSYSTRRELEENQFLFDNMFSSIFEQRAYSCLVWYVRKATKNRRLYYFWSIVGISSPLIATIFTSIDMQEMTVCSMTALVFTLIASLSSSVLCLWNFKSKWRDYRNAAEMLKREWTDYKCELKILGKNEESQSDSERRLEDKRYELDRQFLDRIEQHMAQIHKSWMNKFTEEKDKEKNENTSDFDRDRIS